MVRQAACNGRTSARGQRLERATDSTAGDPYLGWILLPCAWQVARPYAAPWLVPQSSLLCPGPDAAPWDCSQPGVEVKGSEARGWCCLSPLQVTWPGDQGERDAPQQPETRWGKQSKALAASQEPDAACSAPSVTGLDASCPKQEQRHEHNSLCGFPTQLPTSSLLLTRAARTATAKAFCNFGIPRPVAQTPGAFQASLQFFLLQSHEAKHQTAGTISYVFGYASLLRPKYRSWAPGADAFSTHPHHPT